MTSLSTALPPSSTSNGTETRSPKSSARSSHQLSLLLGTSLRILLSDHRTLQGQLESIDSSSLLLSNTLETRAPPLSDLEIKYAENKDRYWPRSDPQSSLEIKGLGTARELGAVVVGLKDVLKIEMEEECWREIQRIDSVM